jgi:hypothetical protein
MKDGIMRLPPTSLCLLLSFALPLFIHAKPLPGTQPLENPGELATQMVAGIGRYLDLEIEKTRADRFAKWKARDTKDAEPMRKLLRERLGMSDTPRSGSKARTPSMA